VSAREERPSQVRVALSSINDDVDSEAMAALHEATGLPIVASQDWDRERLTHVLVLGPDGLTLACVGRLSALGSLRLDYGRGRLGHRLRSPIGRKHPLARALGLRPGQACPNVLDATGGLGRDALLMARLGCEVVLCERNPIIAQMVSEALSRGTTSSSILRPAIQRMRPIAADAREYIALCTPSLVPAVIYLDPMYPHRNKRALVKQDIRILRTLVGNDPDAVDLFNIAIISGCDRVVVKRPKGAPWIAGVPPHHQLLLPSTRYDVYCPG
jgi:16S rRNA (guanine1516-N2)-methyltransferase